MNTTKLTPLIFCCVLLSLPATKTMALPVLDGQFNTAEWAGYYTDTNGVVGPGVGGQAYDAERLGLYFDNSQVAFGLQTGFDLALGRNYGRLHFNPGDLALNVDGDAFYEYAIDFSISGAAVSYTLVDMTSAGAVWKAPYYAQHASASPFAATYTAANIVDTFTGAYSNFAPGERIADNVVNAPASLLYSNAMEGGFDLALLALYGGGPLTMHWTMECGNDIINHTSEQAPVPEPATMLLFGTGLVAFAGLGRKTIMK